MEHIKKSNEKTINKELLFRQIGKFPEVHGVNNDFSTLHTKKNNLFNSVCLFAKIKFKIIIILKFVFF